MKAIFSFSNAVYVECFPIAKKIKKIFNRQKLERLGYHIT